jgi:hypothetical protein
LIEYYQRSLIRSSAMPAAGRALRDRSRYKPNGGQRLIDLQHRREVVLSVPAPHGGDQRVAGRGRRRERDAGLLRGVQAQPQVLEHVLRLEEGRTSRARASGPAFSSSIALPPLPARIT